MWIKSISITNFRAFKKTTNISLAKNITCISGHNGIGKSTILAALSNCCELKRGIGTHINGSMFRGEFSELIVADPIYDTSGDKVVIEFADIPTNNPQNSHKDVYVDTLEFRATLQNSSDNNDKTRYRLIPKKIPNIRNSEAKINWPSYYLGLSRLYPIGETKSQQKKQINISNEEAEELMIQHAKILSMQYNEDSYPEFINIKELDKAKSGINTSEYSSTSNSSGQDNVGQIILTILSFKKLKKSQGDSYIGGILLIDELDATLHPAAQIKLFEYLYEMSKELELQIVFTTHSLSLIEHIYDYKTHKKNIAIQFLAKREIGIICQDTSLRHIKNDLYDTISHNTPIIRPVKIFTEDETARWLLDRIIKFKRLNLNLQILDINISWSHLINLIKSDLELYKNSIIILDPDLNKQNNYSDLKKLVHGYPIEVQPQSPTEKLKPLNILILPSSSNEHEKIEKMLWLYFESMSDTHPFFFKKEIKDNNWQKRKVLEQGPNSEKYAKQNENNRYKNWYNDNFYYIDILIDHWITDNSEIVDTFTNQLNHSYNYFYNQIN